MLVLINSKNKKVTVPLIGNTFETVIEYIIKENRRNYATRKLENIRRLRTIQW